MKNDKLIPGLVLVLIGAAILLSNFNVIDFHWENIIHLWPIFLVIAGVNLVFAHNKTAWAYALRIGVVIVGFGLLLFGNFGNRYSFWPHGNYSFNTDDDDDSDNGDENNNNRDSDSTDNKETGSNFSEAFKPGIKLAKLNISGGGVIYNLSDTTSKLFTANTEDGDNRYTLAHSMEDSIYVVTFKMKDKHSFNFDSDKNKVDLRMNANPVWLINIDAGATALDFDLEKFKVKNLKINGGAASFNIKMGQPLDMTNVDISTGVSSVDISIPENAACSIETNSGLSDNNFAGFNKTGNNSYETPGFSTAKNKMHIHISGGLSGFNVSRY